MYKFPDKFYAQVFLTDRHVDGSPLPEYKYLIILIYDEGASTACFLIDELYLNHRYDITIKLIEQEIAKLKIPFSLN